MVFINVLSQTIIIGLGSHNYDNSTISKSYDNSTICVSV